MEIAEIFFYILLFVVAFLYSSVGHGGASGYLALMTFFAVSTSDSRQTALILNIFVSLIAFIQYYRSGNFNIKLFIPFAITSIPAAFVGGMITLEPGIYKKILAVLLLIPSIKLLSENKKNEFKEKQQNYVISLFIGLAIGFISGIIGIGGGILLSPIIIMFGWGNLKQTAAVSALFIFVNSIAGISGIASKGLNLNNNLVYMVVIALAGGLLGSYMGAIKLNNKTLKVILALVLIIASIKLFIT